MVDIPKPKEKAEPRIHLIFSMEGAKQLDLGKYYTDFEFKAMMNGGYIIRATLYDAHFNLQSELIREGYFKDSRTKAVNVKFAIRWNYVAAETESATKVQEAILIAMEAEGEASDNASITFVAIDPPSYYLNVGDASGGVFTGKVDEVIRQVVAKYAPSINLEISSTIDSSYNKWWMMRQDPLSFIRSFIDWSPSITKNRTHWIVSADGHKLNISEQSLIPSKPRGYYSVLTTNERSTIRSWELLADNALSLVQTKLLSQGLSSTSGSYLDKITDIKEEKLIVKDSTTGNKKIALTDEDRSFAKPIDGQSKNIGWSSISSIPEVYSAGDLGVPYQDYIDGRARNMYLNMMNNLLRVKFQVIGHGEWSSGMGLGTDTIYIRWTQGATEQEQHDYWWMTGNWIVYGFHHVVDRGQWFTDLYCARYDYNAESIKVGTKI